jgi:hypothetical protein
MKPIMQIVLIALLLGAASGQEKAVPFKVKSPKQAASLLTSKRAHLRAAAARALHLREPWEQGRLCVKYDAVTVSRPALEAGRRTALLTAGASDCDVAFLVFFVAKKDRWIPAGTFPMSTKYGSPKYRVRSLIRPGESEIVISGQTVDSGSGIRQRNLTILKLVGDSMRVVFDQPESLNHSIPAVIDGEKTNTSDVQASVFFFVNSDPGVPGRKNIVESREQHVRGHAVTLYRKYVWNPDLSIFRMYGEGPPR